MVMRGVGRKIVMVDVNSARARAEAADISHAIPFAHPLEVVAGEYEDLVGASVVLVAAGVGQKPGETRLQLLERNASIFREVIPQVLHYAQEAVLLVATNPVDVLTHLAASIAGESGIPSSRVVGSGTTLDPPAFAACSVRTSASTPAMSTPTWSASMVIRSTGLVNGDGGGMPLDAFAHRKGLRFRRG